MSFWKKRGPHCNYNLVIHRESDGWYEVCLSCGYHQDISNLVSMNTVGQVKIMCPIEAGQEIYSDIMVVPKGSNPEVI